MTPASTIFLGLTLSFAAIVVVYVASLRRIARESHPFPLPAAVPVATPVYSWRSGSPGLALALGGLMLVYAALWISAYTGGL